MGAGLSFASSKVVDDVDAVIDGETTSVTAVGALTLTATLTPDVTANAVGFSASAFAAASGGVAISQTGGTAHAGITGKATVKAGNITIHSNANASERGHRIFDEIK